MPKRSPNQPQNGNPTAAEIFSVFHDTTMASLEGLTLLLEECADLRAELVTLHGLNSDSEGHVVFSVRQRDRILELQEAVKEMKALQASVPGDTDEGVC